MTVSAPMRDQTIAGIQHQEQLPLAALLVLALTGFTLLASETAPAGLLPQIAAGMNISQGAAGQFVSAYALGTVVAAIPAVSLTNRFRRKPVLLVGISGILLANVVTAFSSAFVLSLAVRPDAWHSIWIMVGTEL